MKAYLSYWTGGWYKKPDNFMLNMHRISAYLAKKHFKEVHFLTHEECINDFKDIPFDSVTNIFDNLDKKYNDVWSVNKLIAYKHICQKGDPFIHIDYDVFLWNGIPERLYNADIFAQCEERDSYHWYEVEKFIQNCPNPGLIGEISPKPLHGINVGILGGNNLDVLQKYSQHALDIIFNKDNEKLLLGDNIFNNWWHRAVIPEQYMLACACAQYNVKPEFYFENGWPGNEETNNKRYTHLVGAKHLKDVQDKVGMLAQKIKVKQQIYSNKDLNPTFFEKINNTQIQPKYKLAIGAIFYNEAPYLEEWLRHYLNKGVEHFYLINDLSNDNFEKVLEPYKDKVTLFHVPKREIYHNRQKDLYNYFFLPILKESKWFLICDVDEYVWSPKFANLQDVCHNLEQENTKYVAIPMVTFGSNNHKHQPRSIVRGFTRRSNLDKRYQKFVEEFDHYKVLAQTSEVIQLDIHSHHFKAKCEKKILNVLDNSTNILCLNHYKLQSEEKWKQGLSKPDVNCFGLNDLSKIDPHVTGIISSNNIDNYRSMNLFYALDKVQNKIEDTGLVNQILKHKLEDKY